jgi:hypothetical protein
MKILFVMEHPGVGSLVPALQLLEERDHDLHLAYEAVKSVESERELRALAEECPGITFGELPPMGLSGWVALAGWFRRSIDYVRYLDPRYPDRTKLRDRAASKAPAAMLQLGRAASVFGAAGVAGLRRTLQAFERCLLPPGHIERYLREQQPDVLLLGHLLSLGTAHAEYLRAGRRLGIRTVFPVRGWDNLTNKGLLRDSPDLLLVWNDLQAREAEELHRIPPDHIRLTGAPSCDHWFGWQPSSSREEFCGTVGLRADRPIVLYVCSSGFVAKHEVSFVRGWIEQLRARGGDLAGAGFLVRPHPLNAAQWADADLGGPQVTVWPRFGEAPHDDSSRRNFFDSIHHSAAVVGINTTAQIESAIVGRPVHTLLADEFLETQQGTLHFHYLKADDFGLLHVGRTFDEHAEQLEESLRGREDDGRNERFLRRFVRPMGLDRSATELVVEAVEELAAHPAPHPDRGPALAPVARIFLRPFAALATRRAVRRRDRRAERATPVQKLRLDLRKRALKRSGAPVVAGPWLGDETGELLYWIPFLRRAQGTDAGLAERLFVVHRASSAAWYEGVGAARAELERILGDAAAGLESVGEHELQGPLRERVAGAFDFGSRAFNVLPPACLVAARGDLSVEEPKARPERRLLEPARLAAGDPPGDLKLPADAVAMLLGPDQADLETALAERGPILRLESVDPASRPAVLARTRGFVGTFGVEAVTASLVGVPALVLGPVTGEAAADLRLATSLLGGVPFGPLQTLDEDGSAEETAERAHRLLDARLEALAGV